MKRKSGSDIRRNIAAELSAILQGTSFTRVGNAFLDRSNPEVLKKIEIENYRWNTPIQKKFQLTVGIDLCKAEDQARDSTADCFPVFRKNSGYLWGDETFLYELSPELPSQQIASELRHHLQNYVLPFFQKCDSVDGVINALHDENKKLGRNFFSAALAVALARLGRKQESKAFFRESIGDPEIIRLAAQAHGVDLDK